MKTKNLFLSASILAALLLSGCASVPLWLQSKNLLMSKHSLLQSKIKLGYIFIAIALRVNHLKKMCMSMENVWVKLRTERSSIRK